MRTKREAFHEVKQIILTDSLEAANVMLESGAWILVDTTRRGKSLFYVLGRIKEYENLSVSEYWHPPNIQPHHPSEA